jgi:tRNA (mo5U34)-methyltransferase
VSGQASSTEAASLRDRVAAIDWYHTLELPGGIVTPGWLDHRRVLSKVPLPATLSGDRCLDVGTFNGFWAFEMERRGAAEVVAIDVLDPGAWDWPVGSAPDTIAEIGRRMAKGDGFEIASWALNSKVTRRELSIYDLNVDTVGLFDVVYVGSLLVHLRDPVRALERVRAVCRRTLVVVDGVDLALTVRSPRTPSFRLDGQGRPWWWYPNLRGLRQLVQAAGFTPTAGPRLLFVPPGEGWRPSRRAIKAARTREGRYHLTAAWLGDPHGALVAAPRSAPD